MFKDVPRFVLISLILKVASCYLNQKEVTESGKPSSPTADYPVETVIQHGHYSQVLDGQFSNDGKYFITGCVDGTALLFNNEGHLIRTFVNEQDRSLILKTGFSYDNNTVFTAHLSGYIYQWCIYTGMLKCYYGDGKKISSIAISPPDGRSFIVGLTNGNIRIYDCKSKGLKGEFNASSKPVSSIAISGDGRYLLSGHKDHSATLWNLSTYKQLFSCNEHSAEISAVAINPVNKSVILTASLDGTIQIWDTGNNKLINQYGQINGSEVRCAKFSPNGKYVVAGFVDGRIKLWNLFKKEEDVREYTGHVSSINSVDFSHDGKILLSCADDHNAILWNVYKGIKIFQTNNEVSAVNDIFIEGDSMLITGSDDGWIRIWDLNLGTQIESIKSAVAGITDIELSQHYLAAANTNGEIEIWKKSINRFISVNKILHGDKIYSIRFGSDGESLFSTGSDGRIILWNCTTGKKRNILIENDPNAALTRSIYALDISFDSYWLAAAKRNGTVNIWDLNNCTILKNFKNFRMGQMIPVTSIKMTQDKQYLAWGDALGYVTLVETQSGKILYTKKIHSKHILCLDISKDQKKIVTGSSDNTINIIDLFSGQIIHRIAEHMGQVKAVKFSPNGLTLISCSNDFTTKIWDCSTYDLLATLISSGKQGWVAMDRFNRYDCAFIGPELLHFVKGVETYNLCTFERDFTRYGILQKLLEQDKVIGKTIEERLKHFNIPEIKIINLRDYDTVRTDYIDVIVECEGKDSGAIADLRLYQNDKRIGKYGHRGLAKFERSSTSLDTFMVELDGGENRLKIIVYNKEGYKREKEIRVFRERTKPSADLFLVVIGINRYHQSNLNLDYGVADAKSISEAFIRYGKQLYREIHVDTLYDDFATKDNIVESLTLVSKVARPEDVFIFFYAGHGFCENRLFSFITTESRSFYDPNALKGEYIQELFTNIKALKQVILIDACYSGSLADEIIKHRSPLAIEQALFDLRQTCGTYVLTAAPHDKTTPEILGHGVFTHAILEGLSGVADTEKDGKLTIQELANYVEKRVPEYTRMYQSTSLRPYKFVIGQDFPISVITNDQE